MFEQINHHLNFSTETRRRMPQLTHQDVTCCLTDLAELAKHEGDLQQAVEHERQEADDAAVEEEAEAGEQLVGERALARLHLALERVEAEEE